MRPPVEILDAFGISSEEELAVVKSIAVQLYVNENLTLNQCWLKALEMYTRSRVTKGCPLKLKKGQN